MKFSQVNAVRIPKGSALKISHGGKTLWTPIGARYVSFGDSIAAGHAINDDWEKNYGTGSQYGDNGNTETVLVPNCYTELIHRYLKTTLKNTVNTTSFAKSGDRVDDVIRMLDNDIVKKAVAKADYVTLCIGANDVLEPALSHLEDYISAGDSALAEIASIVEANLATLADDSSAYSYTALFNKLSAINPDAVFVFTTVYNPYKYLWLEEGKNGFFKPVLDSIPQLSILGFELDETIKSELLNVSEVKTLFNRVNGLNEWSENYVTRLNTVLRNKISAYGKSNFRLADTKSLFETVPDRPISAPKHYNDLVNVEYTRGYDTMSMDWGRMYEDSGGVENFWWNLATKYISLSGLDIGGFASELIAQMIEKVIVPDIDPHPEEYGHYLLMRSFMDALGFTALDRHTIYFSANGATGSMVAQTVVGVDGLPAFTHLKTPSFTPATGYYFTGWNTAADGSGIAYSNGQLVGLTGDLTLYAQWSNIYTIKVRHSIGDSLPTYGSGDTGPMERYALWIDGQEQADLGAFSNGTRVYNLPYGTAIGVIAQVDSGDDRSYITLNGTTVAGKSNDARYSFTVDSDMDIHFEWNNWVDFSGVTSYWNCYVTTY